jgi:hypothetical protein
LLQRWGAAGIGLMFAIWVFTLHLPRVLGLYAIPGALHNSNEWSSLFIAIALWRLVGLGPCSSAVAALAHPYGHHFARDTLATKWVTCPVITKPITPSSRQ